MNRRVLLILVVVALLAVIVVVFVLPTLTAPPPSVDNGGGGGGQVVQTGPTATPIELAEVLVAVQPLPRGSRIPDQGAVAVRLWPRQSIPERALTKVEEAAGKIARTDIFIEQPIVDQLVVDDLADIARRGSDAAVSIPKGLVAITIPVDRAAILGYGIQDGDYVDVIATFLFVDVDPTFQSIKPNRLTLTSISADGSINLLTGIEGELQPNSLSQFPVVVGPSERQRPRLVTTRTIQGAYVVHTGTFPLDGKFIIPPATPLPTPTPAEGEPTSAAPPPTATPPNPDVITLAVSPQDALVLSWQSESQIPITLALRSAQSDPTTPTDQPTSVTLQYMIENYNIAQPPTLPYALEPALRSIRQLILEDARYLQFQAAGEQLSTTSTRVQQ
jgi:Flp pilus assembly protein CpaB